MADPKREQSNALVDLTVERKQREQAEAFADFLEAVETRLTQLTEAHNILDARIEEMHYRLLFVMEQITVQRKRQGVILGAGESPFESGTLFEFSLKDGPAYIARLKEQVHALDASLGATADAIHPDTAPAGPTIADVEALAVSRTKH